MADRLRRWWVRRAMRREFAREQALRTAEVRRILRDDERRASSSPGFWWSALEAVLVIVGVVIVGVGISELIVLVRWAHG